MCILSLFSGRHDKRHRFLPSRQRPHLNLFPNCDMTFFDLQGALAMFFSFDVGTEALRSGNGWKFIIFSHPRHFLVAREDDDIQGPEQLCKNQTEARKRLVLLRVITFCHMTLNITVRWFDQLTSGKKSSFCLEGDGDPIFITSNQSESGHC